MVVEAGVTFRRPCSYSPFSQFLDDEKMVCIHEGERERNEEGIEDCLCEKENERTTTTTSTAT